MDTSLNEAPTQAMREEKKKLRRVFRRFDMVVFTVTAIIALNALGAFSAYGAQALTWLLLSALTFFLPYGLLVAELGSSFPQEGGVYVWCKLAGGRLYAAFAATLYWIFAPLWLGGVAVFGIIAALKTFWFGNTSYLFGGRPLTDALIELAIALLLIWGIIAGAIISLSRGKWISTTGFFAKLALLAIFLVLAAIFVVSGAGKGAHFGVADLVPSNWGLVVSGILPVLIFLWLGLEAQSSAAEEMVNAQRDVPRAILRAGAIVAVVYGLFLLAILLALPRSQLSVVGGFFNAFTAVSRVLPVSLAAALGWLVALCFAASIFASNVTFLIAASRTYAIAALDGAAPLRLGRFSGRQGTPIAACLLVGILATVTAVAAILVGISGSETIGLLFTQGLSACIVITILAYLLIIPTALVLRYKYPGVPRRYRVPGGLLGAWIATLLPMAYAGIACFFLLVPSGAYLQINHLDRGT
ncbi:MAG: APC family permease, partial [Sinobacteraceae bacterium]|nr:APC family permease [Nevskiaceae bacterium]